MLNKSSWIKKVTLLLCIVGAGTGAYYFFKPQVAVYDFNQQRDSAFILSLFKQNWYWLVAEGSDFSAEYFLQYRASSRNPEHLGNETIKILYRGNTPVGFVSYYKKKFYEGTVHFLAVSEQFRSKGYGLYLMQQAIDDLTKQGCTIITLVTRTTNYPAMAIYKKAGFTESHRIDGFVWFEYRVPA